MIGKIIKARLTGIAGGRVYPVILPQDPTLPAVTYQQIAHADANVTLRTAYAQVDCWASSYAEVRAIASQVAGAMHLFRGTAANTTVSIRHTTETDLFEPDTKLYRISQDYTLNIEA
jgi:hypothetical protein